MLVKTEKLDLLTSLDFICTILLLKNEQIHTQIIPLFLPKKLTTKIIKNKKIIIDVK